MALKISHPLYPSKWYLGKLSNLGFDVTRGRYFRDHYMIVADIYLFPTSTEVVLIGPQFTYHSRDGNTLDDRNILGFRKLKEA